MNKIMMAVILAAISSGTAKAAELEKLSARDVVKMAQEARVAIPEPKT
jgi:hypothetical protein